MLVPTLPEARYLILDDADMASLVSVALAAERWGGGGGAGGRGLAPVVVPAWWRAGADAAMPTVHGAVERHASIYSVEPFADELVAEPSAGGEGAGADDGFGELSELLLRATRLAAALGCDSVLFPVRAADLEDGVSVRTVAREIDRAALVSRLASLDGAAGGGSGGCTVITPLVDFDDEQLVDLARDLSVPTESCWWSGLTGEPMAERAAERWRSVRAMSAGVGPAGRASGGRSLTRTA